MRIVVEEYYCKEREIYCYYVVYVSMYATVYYNARKVSPHVHPFRELSKVKCMLVIVHM